MGLEEVGSSDALIEQGMYSNKCYSNWVGWRIQEDGRRSLMGLCHPPFLYYYYFFYKNEVYEQKSSIKQVQNLSENDGNGHFRDSNFQKFPGGHNPQKAYTFGGCSAPLFFLTHPWTRQKYHMPSNSSTLTSLGILQFSHSRTLVTTSVS